MDIKKLQDMIEPVLEEMDIRLYEMKWIRQKESVLQIAILRKDGTMDLDTCADASERISEILDANDPIDIEYTLEVCSPGAERQIRDLSELDTVKDPYVFIRLKTPVKKMTEIKGDVTSRQDGVLVIEYRDKAARRTVEINEDNIEFIRFAVRI